MALKIKSIRGTRDITPAQSHRWQYVERTALEVAERYGFRELRIPTIEKTELFVRSVGETTDVVQKEMYTFDKGKESITLRPEGTAGTVRAVLENSLLAEALPVKVSYVISCFRYERPQAGRQREFHQFGIECFGSSDPGADAEIIGVVSDLLERLLVPDISLQVNSIGCPACRPQYHKLLREYYAAYEEELCPLCRERLVKNPLRLLDCKEQHCGEIAKGAPKITEHLCGECEEHFEGLKGHLNAMGIPFEVNPTLVRGLDYYTKTVFEFITTRIGAQGTVCGGGRYDLLAESMGGSPTPGLGFAMGLERLLLVMEECSCPFPEPTRCDLYIGSMGPKEKQKALALAYALRKEGFHILCDTMGRSVKAQMKYADKMGAAHSCIIGSNELETGKATIKEMAGGEPATVALTSQALGSFLYSQYAKRIQQEELQG